MTTNQCVKYIDDIIKVFLMIICVLICVIIGIMIAINKYAVPITCALLLVPLLCYIEMTNNKDCHYNARRHNDNAFGTRRPTDTFFGTHRRNYNVRRRSNTYILI